MFGWFKKKKPAVSSAKPAPVAPVSEEALRCPFCMKTFKAKDILFAMETEDTSVEKDQIYLDFISDNFLPTGKDTNARRLFAPQWTRENVKTWDSGTDIPLSIESVFEERSFPANGKDGQDEGGDIGDGLGQMGGIEIAGEPAGNAHGGAKRSGISEKRLCPHCHCALPDGIGVFRSVHIGLYGGSRSGKTTYMSMASRFMEKKLVDLQLGIATVVDECRDVHTELFKSASAYQGLNPTARDKERPCFPIILSVKPINETFIPFFLIFQDIAGESAQGGKKDLINHRRFTQSDAFLGIVDVNMFSETPEKREMAQLRNSVLDYERMIKRLQDDLDGAQDEAEKMEMKEKSREISEKIAAVEEKIVKNTNSICEKEYDEVFGIGNMPFAKQMHPRSVQLALTKVDRWMKTTDTELLQMLQASQHVTLDHTQDHQNAINAFHLNRASEEVAVLMQKEGINASLMLDLICGAMDAKDAHRALTAVSSRQTVSKDVGGNSDALAKNMNLLDPILNICRWENLLPVKKEEKD